ncbi:MAG: WD40 repeat domain-containing protein [Anaerolineales bacterium]|nr:WD40 repeat domain-containing protein [Anaerolineales bacterium]
MGNNQIRFYDSQTGKAFGHVTSKYPNQGGFQLLYFSEDGKSLVAVSTNGTISLWGIP